MNVRILPNAPVPKRASATSTMISPRSKPRRRGKAAFETEMLGPSPVQEELDYRAVDIGYGGAARRRLLYFTALIIVIGFAGLAASSVSWRKLSNPTETTLIGRETRGARPQPEEMAEADRPAQNASIVDAQPADVSSDDRAASSAPVGIPASAASIPSPETTPSAPPAQEPAGAKHDDPGYVLAPIEEVATRPKLLFDQAPPLNLDSSSEPSPSTVGKVEKAGDVENASDVENVSQGRERGQVQGQRIDQQLSCQSGWTCSYQPFVPGFLDKTTASNF